MTITAREEIIQYGIDKLDHLIEYDTPEACELHHYLYNEDYFIIGTWKAKQFLENYGAFEAIGEIQQYETDNFGEVSTDLTNPEKVAGMLAYVVGEEVLNNCETLQEAWNQHLTTEQMKAIKKEIEAQL